MPNELCLIMDPSSDPSNPYGMCNLQLNHELTDLGSYHRETLPDGRLWAEWKSVTKYDATTRAAQYIPPSERVRSGRQLSG